MARLRRLRALQIFALLALIVPTAASLGFGGGQQNPDALPRVEVGEIFTAHRVHLPDARVSERHRVDVRIRVPSLRGPGPHNVTIAVFPQAGPLNLKLQLEDYHAADWANVTVSDEGSRVVVHAWNITEDIFWIHLEIRLNGSVRWDPIDFGWADPPPNDVLLFREVPKFEFLLRASDRAPRSQIKVIVNSLALLPSSRWWLDTNLSVEAEWLEPKDGECWFFANLSEVEPGQYPISLRLPRAGTVSRFRPNVQAELTIPDWRLEDLGYSASVDGRPVNITLSSTTIYKAGYRLLAEPLPGRSFTLMGFEEVPVEFEAPGWFSARLDPEGLERILAIEIPEGVEITDLSASETEVHGREALLLTVKLSEPANVTLLLGVPRLAYPLEFGRFYRSQIPQVIVEEFTRPERLIESDDPFVRLWADQVLGDEEDVVRAAYLVAYNLSNTLVYDSEKANASESGVWRGYEGAKEALMRRKGVCRDFARAAVALLRAKGLPARYVTGYLITGEDVKGAHAWFEFYVPGLGWVPADATAPKGKSRYVEPKIGVLSDHLYVTALWGRNLRPAETAGANRSRAKEVLAEMIELTGRKLTGDRLYGWVKGEERALALGELGEAEYLLANGDYHEALVTVAWVQERARGFRRMVVEVIVGLSLLVLSALGVKQVFKLIQGEKSRRRLSYSEAISESQQHACQH